MASETQNIFFQNFKLLFFKDIEVLQKCNSMQYLQKRGSIVTLQICNSMQFPAK